MTRYEKALQNLRKAEAECVAELMEEMLCENPDVQHEDGHWITKEEVVENMRNSWKEKDNY